MTFIYSVERCCKRKTCSSLTVICGVIVLVGAVTVIILELCYYWRRRTHYEIEYWSYHNQAAWPGICKTGLHQSPIALSQKFAYKKDLSPLKMDNFLECNSCQIVNNGHTGRWIMDMKKKQAGQPESFHSCFLLYDSKDEETLGPVTFLWMAEDIKVWEIIKSMKYVRLKTKVAGPHHDTENLNGKIFPVKSQFLSFYECVTLNPWNECHCVRPKISGGGLTQNYTLDNIHFHWPSEHTLDGLTYDLELHMVFYADKYGNLKEALKHPFGVTVMGILFLRTNYTASENFRIIADAVKSVQHGGITYTARPINFHQFLPYDHDTFFAYNGSLTTPGCTEFVNWIVFTNHSNISYLDLKDLTKIYDENQELLKTNNRELQEVNDRTIFLRYPPNI